MSKNSYIIGGGITGLVWNFYHPDWTIITPEIGGQFNSKNLVLLHDTAETRKLLRDLGWKKPEWFASRHKIGFYHSGWITEYQTEELNLIAIQKKMTEWDKPIDRTFIPKSRDMSTAKLGGDSYLKILHISPEEILEKIKQKASVKIGKVIEITDEIIETETETLIYDKVISTIPAPIFWEIYYGLSPDFKSIPVTHIEIKQRPSIFDERFDMIYYNDEVPFSRISKTLSATLVIEFTGIISKLEFEKLFPDATIINYSVITFGRIFNQLNIEPSSNIIFSGRFGKWDYKITLEHVIKQVIDYKKYASQ